MKPTPGSPLLKLLLFFNGLLVLVFILEVTGLAIVPMVTSDSSAQLRVDLDPEHDPIQSLPPVEQFQEAVQRSLFSWNRQPISSDNDNTKEGDISTRWALSSVVNTGDKIYATVANTADGSRLKLETGMYLEEWKINGISPESISLINAGDELTLKLRTDEQFSPDKKKRTSRGEHLTTK